MALAAKPHPLGGAQAGGLLLERADPADPARRGRMVVAAVMVRRAGHWGRAIA